MSLVTTKENALSSLGGGDSQAVANVAFIGQPNVLLELVPVMSPGPLRMAQEAAKPIANLLRAAILDGRLDACKRTTRAGFYRKYGITSWDRLIHSGGEI